VLDLAKIEAGKMDVYIEEFDVVEVTRAVEAIAKPLLKKNENTLELVVPDGIRKMESDVTKLRQMLFNLISNAAKFTEHDTIRLELTRSNRGGVEWLTFSATDSGIGMTPEQLEQSSRNSVRPWLPPRATTAGLVSVFRSLGGSASCLGVAFEPRARWGRGRASRSACL
jgi:light-regulated signal transduction histidine kinase (bacteriophytochrome)